MILYLFHRTMVLSGIPAHYKFPWIQLHPGNPGRCIPPRFRFSILLRDRNLQPTSRPAHLSANPRLQFFSFRKYRWLLGSSRIIKPNIASLNKVACNVKIIIFNKDYLPSESFFLSNLHYFLYKMFSFLIFG